mgnify:CR=1 FL=1
MNFDLLLKGGHLIDPKNEIDRPLDLAVQDGKVAAVDDNIPAGQAHRVIDVAGLYVTCLLYTSPRPRDATLASMTSSA